MLYMTKLLTEKITEWKEIKNIPSKCFKELMQTPLVYDGRNVYDVNEMKENRIEYYSIGR